MISKKKILFVCTVNRMRSKTAQAIYQEDNRFEVRSAGTDPTATTVLTRDLLEWADAVVVMEKHHRAVVRKRFPDLYRTKTIVCLYIPDDYGYMDEPLQAMIRSRFEEVNSKGLV